MAESLKDALSTQFLSVTKETAGNDPKIKDVQLAKEQSEAIFSIQPKVAKAKSKRFNLLMRPSLHDALKKIAVEKGTSVNDLTNQVLADFVKKQQKA